MIYVDCYVRGKLCKALGWVRADGSWVTSSIKDASGEYLTDTGQPDEMETEEIRAVNTTLTKFLREQDLITLFWALTLEDQE
jgi:hypothetical protein